MRTERIQRGQWTPPDARRVEVITAGNILQIRGTSRKFQRNIELIPDDPTHYVVISTGEVKEFQKHALRIEHQQNIRRSMTYLRHLINANLAYPKRVRWCTLTYAENMIDEKRLYNDFRKFIMRLRTYTEAQAMPHWEYIVACEPQGRLVVGDKGNRGVWHAHLLIIFSDKAPFIPNEKLAAIWRHGFTTIKSLDGVKNPGIYLTAYLSDMDIENALMSGAASLTNIRAENYKATSGKAIIKGSRLHLYPKGFRFFRASRNIPRPVIEKMAYSDALILAGNAEIIHEQTYRLYEECEGKKVEYAKIFYCTYNMAAEE